MTLLGTVFMAPPGKQASLSFNLSFDVAFLNNHGFIFFSLFTGFTADLILFVRIILKCWKDLSRGLRVQERFLML